MIEIKAIYIILTTIAVAYLIYRLYAQTIKVPKRSKRQWVVSLHRADGSQIGFHWTYDRFFTAARRYIKVSKALLGYTNNKQLRVSMQSEAGEYRNIDLAVVKEIRLREI